MSQITIDAGCGKERKDHKVLNKDIRKAINGGAKHIAIKNVCGQRFIGAGLIADGDLTLEIYGDAGLDLGVFSEGLCIIVHGNSEYLAGNTLNSGELVVYGSSWDITGMGARGGQIYIMGDGGSRVGIHMKEFFNRKPLIVYGGTVKQYCGEYMAGGEIVVLGLDYSQATKSKGKNLDKKDIDAAKIRLAKEPIVQSDLGAGIHGGVIYVRGDVPDEYLGVYAVKEEMSEEDEEFLAGVIDRFSHHFNLPKQLLDDQTFTKITPYSSRPFGKAYSQKPV